MPQEFKIYKPEQDGRRKILESEHEEVKAKYKSLKSLRGVAKIYGVDKRTIQFIVYPDRLEKLKEHNKQIKHYKKYYNTEARKLTMRKWRSKKRLAGLALIKTEPRKYKDLNYIKI